MKYFSMFSGIGGFELGIQQAYEEKNKRMVNSSRQMDTIPKRQKAKHSSGVGNTSTEQPRNVINESTPTCIGYSEIDKYAVQIYEKHFNHKNYGVPQNREFVDW